MSGPERMQAGAALTEGALALLRAEMQALALLMPGLPAPAGQAGRAAGGGAEREAATEALFDNMPV